MNGYGHYHGESDADDEYERDVKSPAEGEFPMSPTESDGHMSAENTPTIYQRMGAPIPSPTGSMLRWTPDQSADFIASLNMEQYADAFVEEEITGEALIELMHEDLQDLGVASVGHRMTILRSIYDIKIRQNIPVMHDHYVPPSADANAPDANATHEDLVRIINQIKLRDERLLAAEEDLRILREDLNRALEESRRMREETLPALRKAKDLNQPLPTPEITSHPDNLPSPQTGAMPEQQRSGGLSRKFSKKGLFSGSGKMPSPTIHESTTLNPSAAAQAASAQLSASMSSQTSQASPRPSQLPSPTSPPYSQTSYTRSAAPSSRYAQHPATEDPWTNYSNGQMASERSATSSRRTLPTASAQPTTIAEEMAQAPTRQRDQPRQAGNDANGTGIEFMKSFRVSMDESCYKVLPIALKKYQIEDDWRQYSLYIVHGDQERCLGLHEKPLILFKQLASEGKKPMFMLRKHAPPQEGYNVSRTDVGSSGPAGVGTLSQPAAAAGGAGRASYAGSAVQLPGGVL